jgi:hypothetical protein
MNRNKYHHKILNLMLRRRSLLPFLLIGCFLLVGEVLAQDQSRWSTSKQIPGYSADTEPPILIADEDRTVHAFNSTQQNGERVVVYSQWSKGVGWTPPIDIILPPLKQETRLNGAYLDEYGMVHLVFFSGDDLEAGIYYANAPLYQAGSASAWSKPELLGLSAESFPDNAAIVGDTKGNLFVLYSVKKPSPGLYEVHSSDGGKSWSEPASLFQTYNSYLKTNAVQMYVDNQDNVHAVWGEVDEVGHGVGVFYSHKTADSENWAEAVTLSNEIIAVQNAPSIVSYGDELIAIYHGNGSTGLTRYMVRSSDGGESWSERVRPFAHIGSNGPTAFVIDSNDTLHLLFGNRLTLNNDTTVQGMWHSTWEGQEWTKPDAVVSGIRVVDDIGGKGFDPSFASAAMSQGNTILVSWQTDPSAGLNGSWYSYTTLTAPETPLVPLSPPTPRNIIEVTDSSPGDEVMIMASPTPEILPETNIDVPTSPISNNPANSIVIGLIPVIVLLLIVPIAYWLINLSRRV